MAVLWEYPLLTCIKKYNRLQAQLPLRSLSVAETFPGGSLKSHEEEIEVMLYYQAGFLEGKSR